MTEQTIPKCDHCGSELIERETKNKRIIWACPKWRPDGKGCSGMIYNPNGETERKKIFPRVFLRYNVQSKSEPEKFRTVEVYESGEMKCNCFAGEMNKLCRHQKKAGKILKDLVREMEIINRVNFDEVQEKIKKPKEKEWEKEKIWGINFEELLDPVEGKYIWIANIREKFFYKGRYVVGLNEKFLNEARKKNVMLKIKIGEEETSLKVPTEKDIKALKKEKAFEDKKSIFENGSPMRIYYISI